ncbi:MAG: AAA family ATPase [Actinomycetota bacterium]|nr:AAA family ATPase [Actinomycetota bacterium]
MTAETRATLVALDTVQPERVAWLWPGRLPLGKLAVLDGDPAVGKSTLSIDITARVTRGHAWPDGTPCPAGNVLLLSAEDGLADTIRPRLDAAGADSRRVHALTEVRYLDTEERERVRSVSLADVAAIEQAVNQHQAVLVVVDVLMAYLPSGTDSHRDQDIRTVLAGLAGLAERTGSCLLLLRHLNKATGGSPLYRGGGSIGIVGAARAAMLAAVDPDDDTRRVLAVTKSNLAAMPPALAYRLVDSPADGCAKVTWEGVTGHHAADLLGRVEGQEERHERDEAADWLRDFLEERGGKAPASDAQKAARALGIARSTLDRARARAGVTSSKGGFSEGWTWSLPAPRTHEDPEGPSPEGLRSSGSSAGPSQVDGIGPCVGCGDATRRYGPEGGPLCASCRDVA